MNLHLIHGPSTLHSTTTFGHHLREKLLCGKHCILRVRGTRAVPFSERCVSWIVETVIHDLQAFLPGTNA